MQSYCIVDVFYSFSKKVCVDHLCQYCVANGLLNCKRSETCHLNEFFEWYLPMYAVLPTTLLANEVNGVNASTALPEIQSIGLQAGIAPIESATVQRIGILQNECRSAVAAGEVTINLSLALVVVRRSLCNDVILLIDDVVF